MIIDNNEKKHKKEFIISFSILRMYLCFVVVNVHLFKNTRFKYKYLLKFLKNGISVPIFFIMSFFLCYKLFLLNDIKKIKLRLERLIIPYFLWPIIIWLFNNIFYFCLKMAMKISLYDLIIQILSGHNFVPVLWFQLNLIVITVLMFLIHKLFYNNALCILINLLILSYFFQYSNINFKYFSQFSFYISFPFGRFMESFPFCISGYILGSSGIINSLKKKIIKSLYILVSVLFILIKYTMFFTIKGFYYQGIRLHIISIIIFIIFALNPFEKIIIIKKMIIFLTNYTSGIYYLHLPIGLFLSNYISLIRERTIFGSIIIYLICYLISLIGTILFGKTKLKHLFL